MTRASTSLITDAGTEPVAEKSKRNRPGAFSEPAWVAVSPSASRNALCTMWVAVCAREIDLRRSMSTSAWARPLRGPHRRAPLAWCTIRPVIGDWTSRTWIPAPLPGRYALVRQLPAALGVERGAVEHQLDLGSLAGSIDRTVGATMPRPTPRHDLVVAGELHGPAHRVRDDR